MSLNAAMMTSTRPDWNTPANVIELVNAVFVDGIGLDPCSNDQSLVDAAFAYNKDRGGNGLLCSWSEYGAVYVNPPYGREIGQWVDKCAAESRADRDLEIIALLPARTDAKWFQRLWRCDALCFWRGRLKFLGAPSSAPFPSVLAYWGMNRSKFRHVMQDVGAVVFP